MAIRIAERWFERRTLADGITLLWEPHVVPLMRCNIWHVRGRDRDLFIDTGMGIVSLRQAARDLLDKPVTAVATHTHADHIGGHHEFDETIAFSDAVEDMRRPTGLSTLLDEATFDPDDLSTLLVEGYPVEGPLLTAHPSRDFDPATIRIRPARNVRGVGEGDVVSTGDRTFEVLHLPGHAPSGIGLFERATGVFFSGYTIYASTLIDPLHHSNVAHYIRTMQRLRELPVRVVHAGHDVSFDRERLMELAEAYLIEKGAL
jgi:glyoxylase-like metal-dependent hydrolase (beta-lactamase superfamily II)